MSEYYMKMKELISRLKADGYSITGRMIKHYIDIGILQKPEYKCPNQALYADFHYIRLKRILSNKKAGKSIAKIIKKLGIVEREEANLIKSELNDNKTYTKVDILEKLDSDGSILDLAVDTGVISDKDTYNSYELYILICIKNLIKVKKQNKNASGQLIERISEISKLNSIANEISYLINSDKDNSWLYTYLLESIVLSKVDKKIIRKPMTEDNDYKYKKALEDLESMEFDKNYEG